MKNVYRKYQLGMVKVLVLGILLFFSNHGFGQCSGDVYENFTITGTTSVCPGEPHMYVYTANISFSALELEWSFSGGTFKGQSGNTITIQWDGNNGSISASAEYNVVVFDDDAQCNFKYTYRYHQSSNTINTSAKFTVNISNGGPTTFCDGGSVLLTANASPNSDVNYNISSYAGINQYLGTDYVRLLPGFTFKAGVTGSSFRAAIQPNYQWYNNGTPITGAVSSTYTAVASGSYTVTTTYDGCTRTSAAKTVTVTPNPPVPSLSMATTPLIPGDVAKLTVSNGISQQWYKDDVLIPDISGTEYTTSASGVYKVINTANGCISTSNSVTVSTSNNHNYVVENVLTIPGITTESQLFGESVSSGNVLQSINYLNGQGKPIQTINTASSPTSKDVLQPYTYDALGRGIQSFLPLVTTQSSGFYVPTAIETAPGNGVYTGSQHNLFYNTASATVTDPDSKPYSIPETENSPLGRVVKQGGVGTAFQTSGGAYKTIAYGSNVASDIRIYSVSGSLPSSSTTWLANTLSVTTITDEAGVQSQTISNREGLKLVERTKADATNWAETYYLYDERNNLRYILPPELMRIMKAASNFNPTQDQINQWANQYIYDNFGRVVESKVPGTGWVYTVYDARDRVILTQDGVQYGNNQWSYTKYDALNRPVISGVYSPGSAISRTSMQGTVNALNTGAGYQNLTSVASDSSVFPTTNTEQLVITYYDNYAECTFCALTEYQFVSENWNGVTSNEPFVKSDQTYGLAVAGSVKVLGTSTWLNSVSYYNKYGQAIQSISSDHLGGTTRASTLSDFSGKTLSVLNTYSIPGVAINTVQRRFTYDLAGRPLKTFHRVNDQPEVTLNENQYNELGQLVDKKIHSVNSAPYLQSVDYRYSLQGRLAKMNIDEDVTDPAPDYFGMEFGYNNTITGLSTGRTDGLVSGIKWKEDLSEKEKGYGYGYNNFGWLTSSTFKKNDNNNWANLNSFYNEDGLTYDYNGNIKELDRKQPKTATVSTTIDQLTYNYGTGGNQLFYVTDDAPAADKAKGFNDGNTSGNDYAYDANGNLIEDKNKGITSITYNLLNLPVRVTFDSTYLQYTYDASGAKLKQEYYWDRDNPLPDLLLRETDYVGEFVLTDGALELMHHEEGRLVAPNNVNLVPNPTQDANGLEGFTTNGSVTLTSEFIGGQNYVKAVCNQSTGTPGVHPIGGTYNVKTGDSYTFKILGYQSVGTTASLYVWGNNGNLLWPGLTLPVGAGNEDYTNATFTIPSGVTQIQIGVLWNGAATGNTIYINAVKLYNSNFEYQYYLTDQVGSPRVVLQTTPATLTFAATMETENHAVENEDWLNLDQSQYVPMLTPNLGGDEVIQMDISYRIGPARSFKVFPGDVIDASVEAYYTATTGYTQVAAGVMAEALQDILSGGVTAIDGGITGAYNGSGSDFALSPFQGSTRPSAFLNYILFDLEFKPLEAKSFPVQNNPNVRHTVPFDTPLTIEEAGYLFVYLSYDNESTLPVYFDDFKVTYTESPVVQVNGYYPFGMIAYQLMRDGESDNKYLYQGKELDSLTQWHDFGARMYYADLGRWLGVDPKGQFSSPYNGMGNNPVLGVDPDGRFVVLAAAIVLAKAAAVGAGVAAVSYTGSVAFSSGGFDNWDLKQFGKALGSGAISGVSIASFGPLAGGALGGGITSSMNGGDFGKGAIVGAVGGYLSQFGGGSFANDVLWGAGTGAGTGALGAALYDQDIGRGAAVGAAFGGGLAAGFSTVASIRNARDGYGFGTNDGRFNKLVDDATAYHRNFADPVKAQRALDFWNLRNGGPTLNLGNGSTTSLTGRVNISSHEFINGVGDVRNTIAHEFGHYYEDIAWTNNQPGGVSLHRWNDNTNAFGGDGSLGYNYAIKHSGRFHVGLGATSHSPTNNFVGAAWRQYPWVKKWWSLLPRRF